jgi:hypothetical protein
MKSKFNRSRGLIICILLSFTFLYLVGQDLYAQQPVAGEINKTYKITLNDGSVITGKLIQITENEIVISSSTIGEMRLQKTKIKEMNPILAIDEKKSGIWFANPNPSKYLLGNSAIPPEKNSGYYQNTWIFFNSFSYAFAKNFSVSAGFELFSIMAKGDGVYAFYINPKVSFPVADNFYLGGNILYANTLKTVADFGGLATFNAFATYGNRNNNLTAAIGWGMANGEFSSTPLITISGMVRASRRIAFVSENWLVPGVNSDSDVEGDQGYYGIFSYGIRFLGEKTSIDLAFINNPDIAKKIVIGIPWLDFVINF